MTSKATRRHSVTATQRPNDPILYKPENPLIVQSDRTILLEVDNEKAEACRDRLAIFCDLVKSPEHIHTYRMSPLSLWNARAAGMSGEGMEETLQKFAK